MKTKFILILVALFTSISVFSQNLSVVENAAGIKGYVDSQNKLVIPYFYSKAGNFISDRAVVVLDDEFGVIDSKNKTIIPFEYSDIKDLSEGMFCVRSDKYGYFDINGNVVIPMLYDKAESFRDNKALVELKGESFYINKKGKRLKKFTK